MAVKTFEQILSTLSAQEKTLLDNLFAKEPELKDGWLRQDDYSRKQTEMKSKLDEAQVAIEYKGKMEPWAEEAYERIHALEEAGVIDPDGKVLWTEKKTEYETEIEDLKKKLVAGGEMKPEEVDKIVTSKVEEIRKQVGGLTREEAQALYQSEAKKLVEDGFKEREAKFNAETIPFVAGFSASVAATAVKYMKETGEDWTKERQDELFKRMNDTKEFDAFKHIDALLAPAKAKKDEDARVAKRVEEELAKRGMPGGGSERVIPQSAGVGALQAALAASGGDTDLEARIKQSSVEAAKELVAEGKF